MPISRAEQVETKPLLVNGQTASKMLGISERTLWKLRSEGRLSCVRIGRSVKYDVRDLLKFVDDTKS